MQKKETHLDAIRGSLIGGAAGDALGYAVEFDSLNRIKRMFPGGAITAYQFDPTSGKARISDDTQMTLFTANGLLVGVTRQRTGSSTEPLHSAVWQAYQDWLTTQQQYTLPADYVGVSWLLHVPQLFAYRAPGGTCISALIGERPGSVAVHINNSKGCGGIMRAAPVGLLCQTTLEQVVTEGAETAALTHGHPLGYLPAAVLAVIVHLIVYRRDGYAGLKELILAARDIVAMAYLKEADMDALSRLLERAVALAENGASDEDNIRQLGEGWVAEETLAIAVYCALRHTDDFSGALIASVNHDGDSDSTGAVTGNILGAWVGYDAIDETWKTDLELHDVLLEMADDLCTGCPVG